MLRDFMPDYYNGVREMETLMDIEQHGFDKFDTQVERWLLNHFVMHADSQGLAIYEDMLYIPTDYSKSIETRRYDILLRLLPPHPITFRYFQDLLKSFNIPADVQRDVKEQLITTYSNRDDISDGQLDRLKYLLNVYFPANMAYQIHVQSDVQSELPIYVGVATSGESTAAINAKSHWFSETSTKIKLNTASQIYAETTVKPKEREG